MWNIQIGATPVDGKSGPAVQMLILDSGGTGAWPRIDGLSATAFPSGVKTTSVEATEQAARS